MQAGFFMAPLSVIVEGEAQGIPTPSTMHMINEPVVALHEIPSLDTELCVTRNGGLFLRISDAFREVLLLEGGAAASQDRVARNQETTIRPMYRFCEYLSVLDQCRLGEHRNRQWRIVDPSRLYRRYGDICNPVQAMSGNGENIFRMQPNGVTVLMPQQIETGSIEAGARVFDEVVQAALDNSHVDVISLIAQFHRGCCAYQEFDWQASIFDLFSIAELLTNECWRRHVTEAVTEEAIRQPLSGRAVRLAARWASYQSGQGSWRPLVSDLLKASLDTHQIDEELHGKLDIAREARNGWVHGQSRPSLEDLEDALDGAAAFIEQVLGIALVSPGGFNHGAFLD